MTDRPDVQTVWDVGEGGGVELSLAGQGPKRKRVKAFSEAKNLPRTPLPAHEVRADPVF